jgi:hypothetical protein
MHPPAGDPGASPVCSFESSHEAIKKIVAQAANDRAERVRDRGRRRRNRNAE